MQIRTALRPVAAGCCLLLAGLLAGLLAAAGAASAALAVPAIPGVPPPHPQAIVADRALLDALHRLEQLGRATPSRSAAEAAQLLAAAEDRAATRIEALTVQGWLHAIAPDAEAAEAVARRLDPPAQGRGADAAAAAAALVRAKAAELGGDTRRAVALIDEAQRRLPPDASPRQRLRVQLAQAHVYNSASRLDDAIRLGHAALRSADELGLAWWRAEARNELAWNYFQAGQHDPAWQLNQEALAIAAAEADPLTLAHLHTVQGILQDARGNPRGERESMQAALDFARQAGAKYEEALYLANLADYYLKRADYPTALRYASQALPLTRELRNLNGETVALANIGLAQIGMGALADGKSRLRAAIAIDERRGSLTGMADTYGEMGAYLERAGDAGGAIGALHQHRALRDQILQRDQQQAILERREQYDAERRVREIELLRREGALKAQQLRHRELEQALTVLAAVGGVLAVAVLLLLAGRVRSANRRLVHANAQLQEQAGIDPLTGLANRRHCQAVMRAQAPDAPFAGTLLLADLDHFKLINDAHGHAVGDAVLVEVARRLRATLRGDDLVVRWGGEEFLIVVPDGDADAAGALAQRVLDAVGGEAMACGGCAVAATVSIGWATFPLAPSRLCASWEQAIDLVDTAMYLAKAHGRNRAYGVQAMHARDDAHAQAIGRALEDAWHAGEVELVRLDGPARRAAGSVDAERQGACVPGRSQARIPQHAVRRVVQ